MIDCPNVDIGMISPSKQVGLISFPIVPRIVLIPIHAREVTEEGSFRIDSLLVNPGTEFRGVADSLAKKVMRFLSFGFFLLRSNSLVILVIQEEVRFLSLMSSFHCSSSSVQSAFISSHSSFSIGSG